MPVFKYCAVSGCYGPQSRPGALCPKHFRYQMIGTALMIGGVAAATLLVILVVWNTFNP